MSSMRSSSHASISHREHDYPGSVLQPLFEVKIVSELTEKSVISIAISKCRTEIQRTFLNSFFINEVLWSINCERVIIMAMYLSQRGSVSSSVSGVNQFQAKVIGAQKRLICARM